MSFSWACPLAVARISPITMNVILFLKALNSFLVFEEKMNMRYSKTVSLFICLALLVFTGFLQAEEKPEIFVQMGHFGPIYSVTFSPDGKYAMSGCADNTMKLWDVASAREIRTFRGHSYYVRSVAFSPDGKHVMSGSADNTMKLWDVDTGKEIRTFQGHSSEVYSVVFSPNGKYALSGSRDNTMKLWDVDTGKEIRTFQGHSNYVVSVAFSPNGKYALSGSGDKTMKLWNITTGQMVRTFKGHSNYLHSVAFSPDGRHALSGSGDKTMKLWDVATGKMLRTFKGLLGDVHSVAFSPDGKRALSGCYDDKIKLWDVATGKMVRTFQGHLDDINSITFSPDGKYALSASADYSVKLWDIATGGEPRTFTGHTGDVRSVAFSPDGKYALSGSYDDTVKLWDIATGDEICANVEFHDGQWVVITNEGYFNASKNGPAHLNVRLGNRVFGLDQFYDVFYRPDIVQAKLKGEDITALAATNLEEALKNPPPAVDFVNAPEQSSAERVTIRYKITSTGGGIGEVRIFDNGKLVQSDGYYREAKRAPAEKSTLLAYDTRAISDELRGVTLEYKNEGKTSFIEASPKGSVYEGTVTVEAISGENEIGLAAFNKNNTVQSILKTATFTSTIKPQDPHLYVLAVGIDEYKAAESNLKYAVKDAQSIAEKLKEQSATQYKPQNIHVATLSNTEATKTNIIHKISDLSATIKPTDVFILFIASHGVLKSGLYSIVTHDYDGSLNSGNLINSNEIMEISKNVKALTQIFILDTCHAGGLDNFVSGLYDARMTVLARNMGLHMFASASSAQEAMDGYQGKNGMFTYTLLEGLNNNRAADLNNDGKVSIYELGSYAREQTVRYSKESNHSQTPVINDFGKDIVVYMIR